MIIAWCITAILLFSCSGNNDQKIDLSGSWKFRIDSCEIGISEKWYAETLSDMLTLPGSLAENGKGDPVRLNAKWTG